MLQREDNNGNSGSGTTTMSITTEQDIEARLGQQVQAAHEELKSRLKAIEEDMAHIVTRSAEAARTTAHEDLGGALDRLHWKTLQSVCRHGGRTNGRSTVVDT